MYEDIRTCEAILFTTPIYFFDISGQAKILLDRLYPMIDNNFNPRFPDKKVASIYSQGAHNPKEYQNIIDKMNKNFELFGWNIIDTLVSTGTMEADFKMSKDLMDKAFKLGQRLVLD